MPTVDIVLLVVMLVSALVGLVRGLTRELLSLVSLILAVVVAVLLGPKVAIVLEPHIATASFRAMAAFAVVFLSVWVLGALVQWVVANLVKSTGLTGMDRVFGFVFGAARGILVCIVALIALRSFAQSSDWWQSSNLIEPLLVFEDDVLSLFDRAKSTAEEAGIGTDLIGTQDGE